MFYDAFSFLIRNLAGFFILNLLLRFYLQVVRAPFGHPLAQFTVKLTNFVVLPVRRIIPSVSGYDTATLLLAWLTALLMNVLLLFVSPLPLNFMAPNVALGLVMLALLALMQFSFYLMLGAVFIQAIMSWVNPYNPLTPVLDALTRPLLAPVRRVLPLLGGIDLSPLVLILALQMLLQFVVAPIESRLLSYIFLAQ
ncbi:MAG: YggT family protein [Burkholderiales bacterium]|nr:YggT family protein [Burkholderiales bacterium]